MGYQSQGMPIIEFLIINVLIFGALEIFLAGRKNRWLGLIVPILSVAMLVPSTISFVDTYFPIPVWETYYGDETLDNAKIYFGFVYDKEGNLVAFSDMQEKDRETGEKTWHPMEFNGQGRLVGGDHVMKYEKSVIEHINDYSKTDGPFVGKSSSAKEMKWQYIKNNVNGYRDAAILVLLYYLAVVFYFVIYGVMRKRLRRRETVFAEEKKRKIESL